MFKKSGIRIIAEGDGMRRFNSMVLLILAVIFSACAPTGSSQVTSQTPSVPLVGLVDIYDAETLMMAISGEATGVNIKADITIGLSSVTEFEKPGFLMVIEEGVTVTMQDNFVPVYFGNETTSGLINNGTLVLTQAFEFAMMTFENNGVIRIADGGMLVPCYSTIQNNGEVIVEAGGELRLERETTFNNVGTVTNHGIIKISYDGGAFHNLETGTLVNQKTVVSVGIYTNEGKFIGEGEPIQ